jgi:hypothetical protein
MIVPALQSAESTGACNATARREKKNIIAAPQHNNNPEPTDAAIKC